MVGKIFYSAPLCVSFQVISLFAVCSCSSFVRGHYQGSDGLCCLPPAGCLHRWFHRFFPSVSYMICGFVVSELRSRWPSTLSIMFILFLLKNLQYGNISAFLVFGFQPNHWHKFGNHPVGDFHFDVCSRSTPRFLAFSRPSIFYVQNFLCCCNYSSISLRGFPFWGRFCAAYEAFGHILEQYSF